MHANGTFINGPTACPIAALGATVEEVRRAYNQMLPWWHDLFEKICTAPGVPPDRGRVEGFMAAGRVFALEALEPCMDLLASKTFAGTQVDAAARRRVEPYAARWALMWDRLHAIPFRVYNRELHIPLPGAEEFDADRWLAEFPVRWPHMAPMITSGPYGVWLELCAMGIYGDDRYLRSAIAVFNAGMPDFK